MSRLLFLYTPAFIRNIVYMMQVSDYNIKNYYRWLARTNDFSRVTHRGSLVKTIKARLLLFTGWIILGAVYVYGVVNITAMDDFLVVLHGAAAVLMAPYIVALVLPLTVVIGDIFIQKPREKKLAEQARHQLSQHPSTKIAIAGSYGKTSFKEILATVLGETLHVAASPGNMNTDIGLSRFAAKLDGYEDVLIFELGEEKPGDVTRLSQLTNPNMGVITGIAAAHLESFGSREAAGDTIFELENFLGNRPLYKNGESDDVMRRLKKGDPYIYNIHGVNGWKVTGIKSDLNGTQFVAKKGKKTVRAKSALLGTHHVGPLVAAIDIADSLGMKPVDIEQAIGYTKPFEHRMAPRDVAGATIIDDTYNGNMSGVQAGLHFLKDIRAKRKIYVTPGLVEQGEETQKNHEQIGELAGSVADIIVLMQNSTTSYMNQGIENAGFKGELKIIEDPLDFYNNLEYFVIKGDVMLMQNDWTDNYS